MKKSCEGTIHDALSPAEITILREIIEHVNEICITETGKTPAFLLIGMRALHFYFGKEPFAPALFSIEIDLNFDILMEWTPYRHKIPNMIKNKLESLGYQVKPDIGLVSILKAGLLIHLTVIFEHKKEYIGSFIPELQIHAGNKYFLLYSKLSRGDPVKDLSRLKYLFRHCKNKIEFDRIFSFAFESELETIKTRITQLLENNG